MHNFMFGFADDVRGKQPKQTRRFRSFYSVAYFQILVVQINKSHSDIELLTPESNIHCEY